MSDSYFLGGGRSEGHGEHEDSAQYDRAYTVGSTEIVDNVEPPEELCGSATL